jgi:Zn-dependent membrane protease YugP
MPYLFFDPLYLLLTVPALIFSIWAQFRVKSTFKRFSQVGVRSGMTGAEAAAAVMRAGGVSGVAIERHQGFLSDHYDPKARALRLSPEVHDGRSVSSIAVAAHEAGHSIQDAVGYGPLILRSKLVPIANIGSRLWILPFLVGSIMAGSQDVLGPQLMALGVVMFAAVVLFQLVTLPTEFDASNRAKVVLAQSGIVSTREEADGVNQVLGAAALTYVAAAAASIMQLIYLILRMRGSRD